MEILLVVSLGQVSDAAEDIETASRGLVLNGHLLTRLLGAMYGYSWVRTRAH